MYQPNFNDARVQRRMKDAFAFTIAWLGPGGRPMGKQQFESAYGKSNNPLSAWLRSVLLICTDSRYNKDTGQTKRWAYKTEGVLMLADALGYPVFEYNPASNIRYDKQLELFYRSYAVEYLIRKFQDQLEPGKFRYRDSSNRLWSPLQNLRRGVRTELLASYGYQYQYDIESCAPTLLYQVWQNNQKFSGELVELKFIQELIDDKSAVRDRICAETGIEYDKVKTAITSLFNGAKLVTTKYAALFKELDSDPEQMEQLKQNAWIQGLRRDVKNLWRGIAHGMPGARSIDSTVKWQIYFQLERLVVDQMDNYLKSQGGRTFRIHDCLVSDVKLDPSDLEHQVITNTGYWIKIERQEYSLATQV